MPHEYFLAWPMTITNIENNQKNKDDLKNEDNFKNVYQHKNSNPITKFFFIPQA